MLLRLFSCLCISLKLFASCTGPIKKRFFSICMFIFSLKLNNSCYGLIIVCHMQNECKVKVVRSTLHRIWGLYLHNTTRKSNRKKRKSIEKNSVMHFVKMWLHICQAGINFSDFLSLKFPLCVCVNAMISVICKLVQDIGRHLAANK